MTKTEFDNLLRREYCRYFKCNSFGYPASDSNGKYPNYFDPMAFQEFTHQMKEAYPHAYIKYAHGKGSELFPHNYAPPKMASIASSSRFCYLALRNGAQAIGGGKVEFEYECCISGIRGTAPQMDAYSAEGNIFIEVKCHEIFDKHTIRLSRQYYSWLCDYSYGFGLVLNDPDDEKEIHVPLSAFGINEECMFDVKQLLCHLMGIASKTKGHPAALVYLFFKPLVTDSVAQKQIEEIFNILAAQINNIFTSEPIMRFCKANQITLYAFAENAPVMQELTQRNMIPLY